MTPIIVAFHHDDPLPPGALPRSGEPITPDLPEGELWPRLIALHSAVADAVAARITAGEVPTVISGDCLVALGVLAGAQRAGADPGVVWFDAHGDLHTAATSTSGYLGGMALRLAMGAEPAVEPLGLRPLAEERAVLVDARDLDPAEADFLASAATTRIGVDEVDAAALPEGPLLLHVDLDVIDAAELTGMKFPVPGGPSTDRVLAAINRVLATGRVVAVHVACPWHPARDAEETATRAKLLNVF
ncbi:arginase family protein [Actinokineospora sp. NPDC004072]